jgi:hypothetical protein
LIHSAGPPDNFTVGQLHGVRCLFTARENVLGCIGQFFPTGMVERMRRQLLWRVAAFGVSGSSPRF